MSHQDRAAGTATPQEATFDFGYAKRNLLKIKRHRDEIAAEKLILECAPAQKKTRTLELAFKSLGFREYESTRLRFRRVREVSSRINIKSTSNKDNLRDKLIQSQAAFREKWAESKFRLVRGLGEEDEILKQYKNYASMYDVISIQEIKRTKKDKTYIQTSPRSKRKDAELQMMKHLPLVQQYLLQQGISYKPVPASSQQNDGTNVSMCTQQYKRPSIKKSTRISDVSQSRQGEHQSSVKFAETLECQTLSQGFVEATNIGNQEIVDQQSCSTTLTCEKDQECTICDKLNEDAYEYDFYEPVHDDEYLSEDSYEDEEEETEEKSDMNLLQFKRYQPIILVNEDLEEFWPEYLAESESEEDSEDSNAENYYANDYPEEGYGEDWEDYDDEVWDGEVVYDDDYNENEGQDEEEVDVCKARGKRDPYENNEFDISYDSEEEAERQRRQKRMYQF